MRIKLFYGFVVCGLWFVVSDCAQIVTPSGGPKDTAPPRVVKYIPDSGAVNVKSQTFTFVFDEYIQLKDLHSQLLISPPVEKLPEIKLKGKTLSLKFSDTLKKNTTYAMNFGNAIADITEGNALDNFQYVFSTGNFLDSLSLSGTVQHAFDQKTEGGILVMLYDNLKDSVPYKQLPVYFTKTKSNGTYQINNIRPGTYKAFALKEKNGNYLYDAPDENIAFCDTILRIYKNSKLDFFLFKEEAIELILKKFYVADAGRINFVFSRAIDNISVMPVSPTAKQKVFFKEMYPAKDTVSYWYKHEKNDDTIRLQLSVNESIFDTIEFCGGCVIKKTRGREAGENKLAVKLNTSKDNLFDYNQGIQLIFNHPIKNANTNGIVLQLVQKKVNFTEAYFTDSIRRSFVCKYPLVQNSSYKLFIPPATFTDIFGLTNDTIQIDFKTQEENYYGMFKLNLNFKLQKEMMILQLLDEKDNVLQTELTGAIKTKEYSLLHPGKYKLKIIYDRNGNEKWTTGNYLKKIQPEKVFYYPGIITIRSNWDMELDWKVE